MDGVMPLGRLAVFTLLLVTTTCTGWSQSARSPEISQKNAAGNKSAQPDGPAAVPARPTVSTPAQLSPPGYLQFEQGFLEGAASPGAPAVDKQFSVVQNTKLALNHHLLIQSLDQPFAHSSFAQGPASSDSGDLTLGTQLVLVDNNEGQALKPTVALGYNGLVRGGTAANLDTGGYAHSAVVLVSGNIAGLHYDTNALFNEQQGQDAAARNVRRAQFGQTLSVTRQLTPAYSITAELWHFTQPFVASTRNGALVARANAVGLLVSGGYTVRPNLVLDVAVDRGLTSTSTAWEGIAGFTYLLPRRLWPGGKR